MMELNNSKDGQSAELPEAKPLDFDDPEYIEAHREQITEPRHHIISRGEQEVELVGPRHVYDPESEMAKQTIQYVKKYLSRVPKERQLIMVEGYTDKLVCKATLQESIRTGGEPSGVVYLARESGSPVISPEAPHQLEIERILNQGFSREQIALYYALRLIPGSAERGLSREEAALRVITRAGLITPQETGADIGKASEQAINTINEAAANELGRELIRDDGQLNLDAEEVRRFLSPSKDDEAGITSRLAAISSNVRDEWILKKIRQSLNEGKSPLVVYGASHIVKLKPAVEYMMK